jgi:peptidoglycan hydrolase-like protein with peptidoglycan-binding domain
VIKKFIFIILVLGAIVYLTGCGKKQETLEEMQAPMSMEALTALNTTNQTTAVTPANKPEEAQITPQAQVQLKPLPPAGPYRPSVKEIQTALKNAGYYTVVIDGKIGPLTKKAIEEFQKANGLKVDGKVGLQTWGVLSKYLNPEPVAVTKTPTKKR